MFDDIHGRYDLLNSIISFGQDRSWRKLATRHIPASGIIVDLCSGGGELALELFRRHDFTGLVVLADVSRGMLSLSHNLVIRKYGERCFAVICDVEKLPFKNDVFVAGMSAFCLRNLSDLAAFSQEVNRTLMPDGAASHLEIAHPENAILSALFELYFYKVSPLIARVITSKAYAYRYLPASLKSFPSQERVCEILGRGWRHSEYRNILGGIAAVYALRKGER